MTVAEETDETIFVSFDGEIAKLTIILAADAGHLLVCLYLTTQQPYCKNYGLYFLIKPIGLIGRRWREPRRYPTPTFYC